MPILRCGKIVDVIKENKQFYLKQTDRGIKLKENHNYDYQIQGLMGGDWDEKVRLWCLDWCRFLSTKNSV